MYMCVCVCVYVRDCISIKCVLMVRSLAHVVHDYITYMDRSITRLVKINRCCLDNMCAKAASRMLVM